MNCRLIAALREIETICTETATECRARMGTRVGNSLVVARAAIAEGETCDELLAALKDLWLNARECADWSPALEARINAAITRAEGIR